MTLMLCRSFFVVGGGGGADGWISSYIKHHDCVNHFD